MIAGPGDVKNCLISRKNAVTMLLRTISRREFCGSLATAIAAAPALAHAQSLAKNETLPPVIDTHQHLWDLRQFKLPWLTDYESLRRNYLIDDYWKAAQGTGIAKTIYMEVDVAPEQREAEVDYVVALAKEPKNRMAAAVVGGQPEAPEFARYVRRLKANGVVKGVRAAVRSRGSEANFELDRDFVAGVRLLGENGLSFDINVPPDQLARGAALVDAAPDTRYVLDHCGNVAPYAAAAEFESWRRGIAEVAKRKQVVCKVSGFITNSPGKKPTSEQIAAVVNHVYACFGPDRLMFAGDWPVCTLAMSLADWVAAVRQVVADKPAAEQTKLFHDNAAKFYGV
jgi:predicted TIM-barrel fold metal-dependent hydrolase